MSCNWGALGLSWSHVHSPKFDAGWKKKICGHGNHGETNWRWIV